jgi:hypothetical protein
MTIKLGHDTSSPQRYRVRHQHKNRPLLQRRCSGGCVSSFTLSVVSHSTHTAAAERLSKHRARTPWPQVPTTPFGGVWLCKPPHHWQADDSLQIGSRLFLLEISVGACIWSYMHLVVQDSTLAVTSGGKLHGILRYVHSRLQPAAATSTAASSAAACAHAWPAMPAGTLAPSGLLHRHSCPFIFFVGNPPTIVMHAWNADLSSVQRRCRRRMAAAECML